MLDLMIESKHGNTARVFPHSGFFGVTTVVIAGCVHMKLPEELKNMPIRSLQVAVTCYETTNAGSLRSSDGEHILWEKRRFIWQPRAGDDFELLEDKWDIDFRITVPPEVAQQVRSNQLLREWRTQWRLEILIEHQPIRFVGSGYNKRFKLNLYDHAVPAITPPPMPSGGLVASGKDREPAAHVFLAAPATAYGPTDNVPLAFAVRVTDPSTTVRKVQVVLERRLEVYQLDKSADNRVPLTDKEGKDGKEDDAGSMMSSGPSVVSNRSTLSSIFHRSSTPRLTMAERAATGSYGNLIDTQHLQRGTTIPTIAFSRYTSDLTRPPKVETHKIGVADCEITSRGDSGSYWAVGNIALPRRTANGGSWDIGETGKTALAHISFGLYARVWIKRKGGSSRETTTAQVPIIMVGMGEEDRARASAAKATQDEARAILAQAAHPRISRPTKSPGSSLYLLDGDVDISSEHVASISKASLSLARATMEVYRMSRPMPLPRSPAASPPANGPPLRPILRRPEGGREQRNPNTKSRYEFVPPPPYASPVSPPSSTSRRGGGVPLPSLQSIFPSELYPASGRQHASYNTSSQASPTSPTAPLLATPGSTWTGGREDPLIRRERAAGRRISSATSDDEEQPVRNRPRLGASTPTQRQPKRGALPSLDALGTGLPALPEDYRPPSDRRPRTAPSFSAYSAAVYSAPPPPLSGAISRDVDVGAFRDGNKTPTQEHPQPGFSDSPASSAEGLRRPSTSGSVFGARRTVPPPLGYPGE
ncbi:hypothetical protein Q8F55_001707 [Vanrija albida]|uniref:Arrestin C-terminal-like domain-containing protein n=1 Tax=Vanrija albida TaxID=181172 RepID=A0ABR3Q7Z8_9TREE